METAVKSGFSFDEFAVDPHRRVLLKRGDAVELNPKTFDLLLALIARPGEIVSKDELLDAVWGEQFVEEGNLTVNISLLRKALGENATAPRFLITISGKGYKFIADVKRIGKDINSDSSGVEKKSVERSEGNRNQTKPKRLLSSSDGENEGTIVEWDESVPKGTRIEHFEIIEEVGRGGMGEVFLAKDERLNRRVALKLLAAHITADKIRVKRFRQEALAISALNHPNIISIYEIGQWHGRDFITTEFVDGMTLRTLLQRKRLSTADALDVALQTASALAAAHGVGIIHRDIKPENIMIREDGLVKILDFGIAKYKPSEDGRKGLVETAVGEVIGTAAYMSPEQARGIEIDERTDIWSLGVILYEMTAGKLPFPGKTKSDRIAAILEHEPESLTKINRKILPELERIVTQSLAKDKEKRYAEIGLMAEELHLLQKSLGGEKRTALRLPPKKFSPFNHPYVFAGIAAVFLCAVFAAVFLTDFGKTFWQSPQTRTQPIVKSSQQRLISTFPGSHIQPSFSPDGKRIAFIKADDKSPQVWIKDLDAGEPTQVTFDKARAERPRWSPIDSEIAYTCGSDICLVSAEGGKATKIINGGRNPNWSWDGKRLVFERGYEIWTANKDGKDQRIVKGVPPTDLLLVDRMPAFSPDGSQIAFFQNEKGPMGDYWIIPAAGGEAKRLTSDLNFGGAAGWMPDGNHIVFPSQRGGSLTLWRVAVDGGEPEPVLSGAGEDAEPDISRDGNKLIYTNTRKSFILTVTDAKTGESRELRESRLEITKPTFSPDGSKIAFFGFNNSGDLHIFITDANGENLVQITKGTNEKNIMPQWSENGRTIYYYQMYPTNSFRKIPATGGKVTEIVTGWDWDTHNDADVSPDETKIIYTRLEKGKSAAAFIRDIATGKETEFTLPLRYPRWSHDGNFITGTLISGGKQNLSEIAICPVEGDQCRKITNGYYSRWSSDDSHLYYYSPSDIDGESVWKVSTKGGDEKKVADLRPMISTNMFYNVSPQGQIVWFKLQQNKSELWLANFSLP